jgi:hypothetical protein
MDVLRRRRSATGAELREALGVSQPTLSRMVAKHREELLVFGRTSSARYAARDARGSFPDGVPVYRVSAGGAIARFGAIVTLVEGQYAFLPESGAPSLHPGLPWFVEELRPHGFLGRLFARSAVDLGLPNDARLWSSDQLLRALVFRPRDLPGDLLLGEQGRDHHIRQRIEERAHVAPSDYASLIEAQLSGEMPGSSAGGEQPKFACFGGSPARHLLVKYSPKHSGGDAARRWADLLRCEELALRTLGAAGHAVATARYDEHGGRSYLEVDRFDRTANGHLAVVTGTVVDAEHVGSGAWVSLAEGLTKLKRLTAEDAERVRFLHLFGGLIGNTDMHLGNVAFFTDDYEQLRLAPVYDMLPMVLRPSVQGELPEVQASPPIPTPENATTWIRAAALAQQYLTLIRAETSVDPSVKVFAERTSRKLESALRVARTLV